MNALITVLAAIVGALVYALATPAPTRRAVFAELGRLTFLAAMIALMIYFSGRTTHLF